MYFSSLKVRVRDRVRDRVKNRVRDSVKDRFRVKNRVQNRNSLHSPVSTVPTSKNIVIDAH